MIYLGGITFIANCEVHVNNWLYNFLSKFYGVYVIDFNVLRSVLIWSLPILALLINLHGILDATKSYI